MVLVGSSLRAAAESTVTELSLEDGGVQRVLFISPANPSAILIMLPGGNGMVDFGPGGIFRDNSFLVRTLPLWQEQGFAAAVLSPPNGMSFMGTATRQPTLGPSDRRWISSAAGRTFRSGWRDESGSHRRGRRRRPDRWQDRRCRR